MIKTRHMILLLLLGLVAIQCLYYFPLLPRVMASHFDASGHPNGWSTKEVFFGLYVCILALMIFGFFIVPRLLQAVPPSLINLPNREYWLAPERKDQAMAMIADDMGWFGIAILMLLIATIQLAIQANLAGGGLLSDVMWLLLGGFVVFAILWTVRLYRRFALPPS